MLLPYLSKLNLKKIVLASGSPRRHELLRNQLGLKFDVCVSDFEELLPKHLYTGPEGAARYAVDTARGKVVDVYRKLTRGAGTDMPVTDLTEPRPAWVYPDLIIGADTVVEHAGLILEKPDDDAMATRMLTALSGGVHHVHTGVVLAITVVQGGIPEPEPFIHAFSVTTTVTFDELSDETIQAYIKTGEPFGKAGSYGIQGIAGSFVRQIDGCFFGVVGFPIHRFASEMVALIKEGRLQIDDS